MLADTLLMRSRLVKDSADLIEIKSEFYSIMEWEDHCSEDQ